MCASPGDGCEAQSQWGSFYIIRVQPGLAMQLVQCGESRRRLQSTFPSALSLPPSFPPAQIGSLLQNLPQGPTALSRSFPHLVPSPDPETWSPLSSREWEMGRPALSSESFESLRSAVNPRP